MVNIMLEDLELKNIGAKMDLRDFALRVLDDEHGIRMDSYVYLRALLMANGSEDITKAIDVDEKKQRVYIGEDFAEDALRDISKWQESMDVEVEVEVETKDD